MKLAAVISETRRIPNMKEIIYDHLEKLPPCDLLIYHDDNAHSFAGIKAKKYRVKIAALRHYNALMTSIPYWTNLIAYDRVIIFQTDSKILRDGLEEFYQWDYVGAPWKFQEHGGNGGLSLRNPKAMLRTIMRNPYSMAHGYEDVYFSNHIIGKLAPRNVCKKFACETIFELGTWGYHAIHNYLSKEQIYEIENQYKKSGGISPGSDAPKMAKWVSMGVRGS